MTKGTQGHTDNEITCRVQLRPELFTWLFLDEGSESSSFSSLGFLQLLHFLQEVFSESGGKIASEEGKAFKLKSIQRNKKKN